MKRKEKDEIDESDLSTEAKAWLRNHARELPAVDDGGTIGGKRFVLGVGVNTQTGNLGIAKGKHDASRLFRKGHIGAHGDLGWSEHEEDARRKETLERIAVLKKRLAEYDDEKQVAEGRIEIAAEIEDLELWYDYRFREKTEEEIRARDASNSDISLSKLGFESLEQAHREFRRAVFNKTPLPDAQYDAFVLSLKGKTQAEIAAKLKISQQAVSKALNAAIQKIEEATRLLGGPHQIELLQVQHWADTQGLSEWGRKMLLKNGTLPTRCHHCPETFGGTITSGGDDETDNIRPAKVTKTCRQCSMDLAETRQSCPYCGGELSAARKEKSRRK